ncbi:MAG: O-antigen ligase family protein [Candidatus Roizmanbacteria bacterium]|nr:O-antigen ligase family protein [Candidatus Roizmanbacteria bacterium]
MLILVLFCHLIIVSFSEKHNPLFFSKVTFFVIIFFISQSISVLKVININSFLVTYKNIVFGIIVYFITLQFVTKENVRYFFYSFLLSALINIIFECAFIYTSKGSVIFPFNVILHSGSLNDLRFQTSRGRYFGDSLDEALVPFLLFTLLRTKRYLYRILTSILYIITIFLVIISGWRIKLLMLIFATVTSFTIYIKSRKYIAIAMIILIIVIFIGDNLLMRTNDSNLFQRFVTEDRVFDSGKRFDMWSEAYTIGTKNLLLGVGIGNYYDNLTAKSKQTNQSDVVQRSKNYIRIDDPHNFLFSFFANTGILGAVSFLALLIVLIQNHISFLFKKKRGHYYLIIMFWTLFLFSCFNPFLYFSYQAYFFFLIAFIEKVYFINHLYLEK